MSSRFGWLLFGLILALGCDPGGSTSYSEPPADSYTSAVFQLRIAERQISVDGARVSAEFWAGGIRPVLGRSFVPEEYGANGYKVVVLSHELWEQSFGADPQTIGRAIELDGSPTTVIGILPPGFQVPETARLWVPRTPPE